MPQDFQPPNSHQLWIVYGALLLPVVVTFILHFGCFLGFYVTVVIDAIINGCISVWRSCSSRYCYVLWCRWTTTVVSPPPTVCREWRTRRPCLAGLFPTAVIHCILTVVQSEGWSPRSLIDLPSAACYATEDPAAGRLLAHAESPD